MSVAISAILPVRNAAEYVYDALASVYTQTRVPDEVVVVDGASTDETRAVVAEFADARVVEQLGVGLADARNLGVAVTTGPLVCFLDADDAWAPDKVARQAAWLDAHPDVGVVTGMMVRVGPAADPTPVPGMTPSATLIRRAALRRVGPFDVRHRIGADTDWLMRAREAGVGPVLLDDVVLSKGTRHDSLSRDVERYRRELLQVARESVRRREGRAP